MEPGCNAAFEGVLAKVQTVNDVYESRYITRSLVVCGLEDLETMCLMKTIMQRLDYPVETLTVQTSKDILGMFLGTSVRVLIVSELCGALFETLLAFLVPYIDVVFVDSSAVADMGWVTRAFEQTKIVML